MSNRENTTGKDFTCVYEQEKGDLLVRLLEGTKPCGHPGYLIEVFLRVKGKFLQTGCFACEDAHSVIGLLLDAVGAARDCIDEWKKEHSE